ncbi:DUF2742 domain-containing protein [Mycolicibacterium sp. 050158]|uniref:DUF2742 domain-containing protein n=1 Tax=Mycolicibacterium sp. 050158 TaxID=3090602 RepID=UPI00299CF740|nr:DUF2742 domain-containing protein [Mycolicibacterium sp. 050158]MDX1890123.1 DUF2742 domain-containing protein [Mycolicibacterium sp. 050158]
MTGSIGTRFDWWPVHLYVESKVLTALGSSPTPGTLPWVDLDDDDPAKTDAVLQAGVWWAVAEDAHQEALVQASQDVAGAVDCQSIARGVKRQEWRRTAGVYIPREVA